MSTPAPTSTDPGRVRGVVLAAGKSSRAGFPKALAILAGAGEETLVERAVGRLLEAGASDVTVVVAAPHEQQIRETMAGVRCVANPTPELGMLSSLQAALSDPETRTAGAVVVSLVDHPDVAAATIGALVRAWRADPASLVCLRYQGRGGHPFLLAGDMLERATSLAPTSTLRDLQALARRRLDIETDDPYVLEDLDTAELLEDAGARRAP